MVLSDADGREALSAVPDVVLDATRALLWIKTPADARIVATQFVIGLGATIVAARSAESDALPVDISFGDGEPLLPVAPPASAARALLERYVPRFVDDGRRALELTSRADRFAEDASIDTLTRVPNRRMLGRALGRLRAGDVVIMMDLDHFKHVNDTLGHDAGDRVLRAFGATLRATVRGGETVGRYGGEEFVIVLSDESDPEMFLGRLRDEWEHSRPESITFSAGIARASTEPSSTLAAADRAMYRAKESGRDRWCWAAGDDDPDPATLVDAVPTPAPAAFVAFSQLEVPDGASEAIDVAFRDRLGAVDRWPGFRALEVWADLSDPTAYAMVSWWESPESFVDYMRSQDHADSHQRIPTGEHRPRPREFRRFRIVAR